MEEREQVAERFPLCILFQTPSTRATRHSAALAAALRISDLSTGTTLLLIITKESCEKVTQSVTLPTSGSNNGTDFIFTVSGCTQLGVCLRRAGGRFSRGRVDPLPVAKPCPGLVSSPGSPPALLSQQKEAKLVNPAG